MHEIPPDSRLHVTKAVKTSLQPASLVPMKLYFVYTHHHFYMYNKFILHTIIPETIISLFHFTVDTLILMHWCRGLTSPYKHLKRLVFSRVDCRLSVATLSLESFDPTCRGANQGRGGQRATWHSCSARLHSDNAQPGISPQRTYQRACHEDRHNRNWAC